jgi:selT/selW/selH-like putative selenoprotein
MPQASSLEAELKARVPDLEVELVGGRGGIFDVYADDRLVFSKDVQFRFPQLEEVVAALNA